MQGYVENGSQEVKENLDNLLMFHTISHNNIEFFLARVIFKLWWNFLLKSWIKRTLHSDPIFHLNTPSESKLNHSIDLIDDGGGGNVSKLNDNSFNK